jgi:hypothetical protein
MIVVYGRVLKGTADGVGVLFADGTRMTEPVRNRWLAVGVAGSAAACAVRALDAAGSELAAV